MLTASAWQVTIARTQPTRLLSGTGITRHFRIETGESVYCTAWFTIRIAPISHSRYNFRVMMAPLLVTLTILGTEPRDVFANAAAPVVKQIATRETLFKSSNFQATTIAANDREPRSNVVRGQSPYGYDPYSPEIYAPYDGLGGGEFLNEPFLDEFLSAMNPFSQEEIHTIPNYYDPFGIQMGTGSNGPQGYRLGWLTYNDFTTIPSSDAEGTAGSMKIVAWNSFLKYSKLIGPGMLFNGTGWFNARWWDGPTGVALPPQVDQFSTDLELAFFDDGPWSGQIAFHPQIVSTYDAKLNHYAFNFDGRVIAMYRASPEWSFVGGVAIWDRVNLMVVPHAGVIWTPDDRWEFRILYPRSRISYFLGNWSNADVWLYGQAEYTAEAWQSVDKESPDINRIQLTDDRLSLGLRWDSGRYSFYVEGGYVFNRQVKFDGSTPGFDLANAGMFRIGLFY